MTKTLVAALTCAALLLVPNAAAHPYALPVDNPVTGGRCYLVTDDGAQSFWQETNGKLDGGVEAIGGGESGLQMDDSEGVPADTEHSYEHWAHHCAM